MTTEIAIITAVTIVEGEATIIMAITSNTATTTATTQVANVIIKTTSAVVGTQILVALKLREDHSHTSKDLMILVHTMLKNVRDRTTAKVVNKHLSSRNIIKAINSNMGTTTITIRLLSISNSPIQHKANSTAIHTTKLQEEWSHHPIHTCRVAINTLCSSQISNSSNNSMEDSRIIIKGEDSGKHRTSGITTTIGIEETTDPRHIEAVEVITSMGTPLKTDSKA